MAKYWCTDVENKVSFALSNLSLFSVLHPIPCLPPSRFATSSIPPHFSLLAALKLTSRLPTSVCNFTAATALCGIVCVRQKTSLCLCLYVVSCVLVRRLLFVFVVLPLVEHFHCRFVTPCREYPIGRAFVDARVQRIYGGANEIMKVLSSVMLHSVKSRLIRCRS